MECRFCSQEKKLIKAHIIPEWAFRYLYPDPKKRNGKKLVLVNQDCSIKRPVGIYDDTILCQECDNKIGLNDNYAKNVFLDGKIISLELAYLINKINSIKIKLFLMSVLWRTSISNKEELSAVRLGVYEDKFKEALIKEMTLDNVEIIVGKYDSQRYPRLTDKNIQLPHKERINGINMYVIYLPRGFKIWVKLDQRNFIDPLSKMAIRNEGSELFILKLGNYEESNNFNALLKSSRK